MTTILTLVLLSGLDLTLQVDAPSACAGSAAVRSEVDRIVQPIPGRELPRLAVRIVIRRRDRQLQAMIEIERHGVLGVREFKGANCQALLDAAILVVALAFGDGVDIIDEPNAPPVPDAITREHRVRFTEPPFQPPSLQPSFRIAGTTVFSLLPTPGFGAALFGRIEHGAFRLGGVLGLWAPREEDTSTVRTRFAAAQTGLDLCWQPVENFGTCAGGSVFLLRGEGFDVAEARASTAPYFAPHAAFEFFASKNWPVRAVLRTEIAFGVKPPRFEVVGLGEVFTPKRLVPQISIGIEL
ncbi:MAG: hypothetical protein AAF654_12570 [Myxococcota bacterium]